MSTKLDFQLKLLVYQNQLELSFFQNVAKTTKRSFFLLYSIVIRCKVIFISIQTLCLE